MKSEMDFHVYLGTVRGALAYTCCKKNVKSIYDTQQIDGEITSMEWGRSEDEILIGNKNGIVKVYNTNESKYVSSLDGCGAVVGLGSFDETLIIGRQNGVVSIWNEKLDETFKINLEDDSSMDCMVHNKSRNVVGTGGEKNDLKIWDVEKQMAIFKAKSMGHDELNLPIPTSVRGICFFQEDNVVACCTKQGNILMYDERVQRRPMVKFLEPKASYTCITTAYRDRQCLVGTTKGYLQLIDLRQNKCLKTFKSFTGAVTSIICDPLEPFIASASLDRHLRIHNLENKELIYKEYMKLGLTKLIMKPLVKCEPEEKGVNDNDDEYEEIFENMETIIDESPAKTKRKHKSKINSSKKLKNI